MAVHQRGRYLAPVALAATIAAVVVVVRSEQRHSSGRVATHGASTHAASPVTRPRRNRSHPASFYVVQAGDSLSSIAAKTGVPLATLEALNAGVNPTALQTGQRLRLRQ